MRKEKKFLASRNQLNQKLKLMVETPEYVIYANTLAHTRAHRARSVDAHAECFTLNEG